MKVKVFGLVILLAGLAVSLANDELHTWTSTTGKEMKASFVRVEGDNVVLRSPGGKEKAFPRALFSEDSNRMITHLATLAEPGNAPVMVSDEVLPVPVFKLGKSYDQEAVAKITVNTPQGEMATTVSIEVQTNVLEDSGEVVAVSKPKRAKLVVNQAGQEVVMLSLIHI